MVSACKGIGRARMTVAASILVWANRKKAAKAAGAWHFRNASDRILLICFLSVLMIIFITYLKAAHPYQPRMNPWGADGPGFKDSGPGLAQTACGKYSVRLHKPILWPPHLGDRIRFRIDLQHIP